MGKSTISMAIFNSYVNVYQRVVVYRSLLICNQYLFRFPTRLGSQWLLVVFSSWPWHITKAKRPAAAGIRAGVPVVVKLHHPTWGFLTGIWCGFTQNMWGLTIKHDPKWEFDLEKWGSPACGFVRKCGQTPKIVRERWRAFGGTQFCGTHPFLIYTILE